MIRKPYITWKELTADERGEFVDRFYRCWNRVFAFSEDVGDFYEDGKTHLIGYPWEYAPDSMIEPPEVFFKHHAIDILEDNLYTICREQQEKYEKEEK